MLCRDLKSLSASEGRRNGVIRTDGRECRGEMAREENNEGEKKSHCPPLSSVLYISSALGRLLATPYLLLIRYGAVSSTPVTGLEMVALRSCEARDMIYPHTYKDVCARVFA